MEKEWRRREKNEEEKRKKDGRKIKKSKIRTHMRQTMAARVGMSEILVFLAPGGGGGVYANLGSGGLGCMGDVFSGQMHRGCIDGMWRRQK
jgi:hypothetical protein